MTIKNEWEKSGMENVALAHIEVELDRHTLGVVFKNLEHFAQNYDEPGFIDKTATHVTKETVEGVVSQLLPYVALGQDEARIPMDYKQWSAYSDCVHYAGFVALDQESACLLEDLSDKYTDINNNDLSIPAPELRNT